MNVSEINGCRRYGASNGGRRQNNIAWNRTIADISLVFWSQGVRSASLWSKIQDYCFIALGIKFDRDDPSNGNALCISNNMFNGDTTSLSCILSLQPFHYKLLLFVGHLFTISPYLRNTRVFLPMQNALINIVIFIIVLIERVLVDMRGRPRLVHIFLVKCLKSVQYAQRIRHVSRANALC